MIFTICIRGVIYGFSNRGFPSFSLIGFDNVALRLPELVTLIVLMVFLPRVEAAGHFILDISANYLNPGN